MSTYIPPSALPPLHRDPVERMAIAIGHYVSDRGPTKASQVRKGVSSAGTRHRFEEALEYACVQGWVAMEVVPGTSQPGRRILPPSMLSTH